MRRYKLETWTEIKIYVVGDKEHKEETRKRITSQNQFKTRKRITSQNQFKTRKRITSQNQFKTRKRITSQNQFKTRARIAVEVLVVIVGESQY